MTAYVQQLRLQASQKGQRAIDLFQEQERIKAILRADPRVPELDSMLIHGSYQRFPTAILIEKLQTEVAKEEARALVEVEAMQTLRAKLAVTKAKDLSREERLEQKLINVGDVAVM